MDQHLEACPWLYSQCHATPYHNLRPSPVNLHRGMDETSNIPNAAYALTRIRDHGSNRTHPEFIKQTSELSRLWSGR
ncbi:uncharacterized protein LAJ45_05790 [Morchella importuna]|uniref:uncharacterized protein n=1 Tax=Morchella importuna TaxID=1174673 RepID=UPI001E8E72BD|nr:uncharacterized protein LAJ45_05790 [Morchella importuna]KAH8150104.1 hypothetical protein LAJ45_05790 [Morchella importuna]